ncbi:hypothetical protein K503DRAFT_39933 [Rhizopogon vinicolor AM-OR11-026]|uniref:Uncharacterized protein n=1 Tax=Rhizopogon vinicolor AM-OR11-026 TaxID=1314800 RepID=A0A1B7N4Z0_9AGAM|nr:hypothetical protein K503DRAFT_39933 [Rhizopogon vinicolor AM-OR11-026]
MDPDIDSPLYIGRRGAISPKLEHQGQSEEATSVMARISAKDRNAGRKRNDWGPTFDLQPSTLPPTHLLHQPLATITVVFYPMMGHILSATYATSISKLTCYAQSHMQGRI